MRTFVLAALSVLAISAPAVAQDADPYRIEPSIHPELAEHTRHFDKKVYKIGENIYSAVGWSLANTIMIVGDEGVIIVDPGVNYETSVESEKALRAFSGKPVKAVIYTHFHPDHWGGVKAWVSEDDVKAGDVEVIAHDTLLGNVIRQGGTIGPILAMRSAYTFGGALPPEDSKGMNGGIGPSEGGGTATFIAPTRTFSDTLDIEIDGIRMHLVHVPSEAPDEVAVWLPDSEILLSGETIQGPTLPNIHTIRGTKFRDPLQWYRSIDVLRSFGAKDMVPSHGQPVYGADKVEEVLQMTRDGIQFVHDQTIRHMNRGLTPEELAQVVAFPPYLADYKPYLREYYGTVKHGVRQIYNGYLGFFDGDPTTLDPVERVEAARRYVALMGGREKVLEAAKAAYEDGDNQWSAELATHLIRIDHEDRDARVLKAAALRRLGYASMNINWRNWYLTSAMELEGKIRPVAVLQAMAQNFSSADVIAQWPPARLVEGLSVRLRAEDTGDINLVAGFRFADTGDEHALEIRRAIAQFHEALPDEPDFVLVMPKQVFMGLSLGVMTVEQALETGAATVEGSEEAAKAFFGYFDPPAAPIWLTVR